MTIGQTGKALKTIFVPCFNLRIGVAPDRCYHLTNFLKFARLAAVNPTENPVQWTRRKGRGAISNPPGRYESEEIEFQHDGREYEEEALDTRYFDAPAKSLINYNQSPDIALDRSINPYRGCEHGCAYCFARPNHAYLGLSPGLDFETQIFCKTNAAEVLAHELRAPRYQCKTIGLGYNTDAYQPVERKLKITRSILEVLREFRHPVSLITKSGLIERDLDILQDMARDNLVEVVVSITTLDAKLSRTLEPRAGAPHTRAALVRTLSQAGISVGVLAAPIIPFLNDGELENIIETVAERGAYCAGYVVLRLPHELKQLFREWLEQHVPDQAERIMATVRSLHGGTDYDPEFGRRLSGQGEFAQLLRQRFTLACRRHELNCQRHPLRTDLFCVPSAQEKLF